MCGENFFDNLYTVLAKQSKAWWVVIYIFFHSNGLVEQGYDVHKISIKYFRPFNSLHNHLQG